MSDNSDKDREASEASERRPIPLLRFTTDDLPPEDRYRAWHLRDWPRTQPIYRTDPTEPFDTRWLSGQLGPVMFARVEITGMRWERRLDDIRGSDFDPIIISMMKRGEAKGDFDGRALHETPGTFHFHDLARPSLHVSSASLTYNLVLPRELAVERFGPIGDLHGLVVAEKDAKLAFALADQVSDMLTEMDADQADSLGRIFLETLAVALAAVRPTQTGRVSAQVKLRQAADKLIDFQLASRDLGADEIARNLGVSRRRLFDAFRDEGGVRAHLLTRRLERARAALSAQEREEPIGLMAHRFGFADAAHLSRAFRARFGMTPSQYRRMLRADREMLAPEA
ncbi:helix-turn-helix domain-containing protein [Brevundimonas sp. NIBR11]|uniref:helix-turn-helix domain-containing protein n=1 Tax=Brevundimonas sp. NIBR11 TaxID=3015999 RepID=UPI0022EFD898|nr:helix-turn-helix domain-containing protein [Brevundimonas sp. NIBR11]WGM29902.1 Transcriptional activator FeaR [Brevundimonas sp. NIBR11]